MATSMCSQNLQLLVENRSPSTRTVSSQMSSSTLVGGLPILPSRNLVLDSKLRRQKVLFRTGSDTIVSAAHGHRWNWTANTEESRFVPSFSGAQRRKVVSTLESGVKSSTVRPSSTDTRTDDMRRDHVATFIAPVPLGAATGDQTWLQSIIRKISGHMLSLHALKSRSAHGS